MHLKLNITNVQSVAPSSRDVTVWDTDLPGFGLKVTPRGTRSFFLFYRTRDHKQRKPKIGSYPALKPEKARQIAQEWLAQVSAGGDPSAKRQAQRASRGEGTFQEMFSSYIAYKEAEGRRSVGEIRRIFEHDILPCFGKRKPEEISIHEVSKLLDKVSARSPSIAWAVRRQLSAFFSWAIPRLPAGAANPVSNASRPPKVKSRDRVLSDKELKALWQVVDKEAEPWRTALKLLILTGQRRDEVLAADWKEFDLQAAIWVIPASRAKNEKAHIVPLSPDVVALLECLPHRHGLLFPRGTGVASRAVERIRQSMGDVPHWRLHDIRRTVATGLQRLNVRLEVTEAILNHVSGSRAGIVGVYQQHDWATEKRDALEKWAAAVKQMISPS